MTENTEEGLWLYKWDETKAPKELDHFALAAYYPVQQNIRCKIIGEHTDPHGYLWGRCRMYLKSLDPGFFQDGSVKEYLREARAENLRWRKESLETFCERRDLDLSIFPPVPEETKIPKFTKFGPKPATRIDKLLIKFGEYYPILLFDAIVIWLIIGFLTSALLMLPFWPFNFTEKLSIVASPGIFIIPMIFMTNLIIHKGILTKARSVPQCFIAHGRLNQLFKDLKEYEMYLIEKIPGFKTKSFHRHRPHPDKSAYTISIVSEVVLRSSILPMLIKPEKLVLHLEIISENLGTSPLVFSWYDTPRSFFFAKDTRKMIEEIRSWFGRMRHQKIDMDSILCWAGREFPPCEYEKEQIKLRWRLLEESGWTFESTEDNLTN